jgi:transposase
MVDKDLIIQLQQEQLEAQDKLIGMQHNQIAAQAVMIKLLEERIAVLQSNQQKNSTNSSKPPSSDIGRSPHTQSLRVKSNKKPGGQQGHKGETLSFSASPNEIVVHAVKQCRCCGNSLSARAVKDYERRQVFDIPPIEMRVTEHRGEIKSCPYCHTVNKAVFPQAVSQPVQYGSNVQQLAVYFTQYQLLPYGRTAAIFKDLFGHSLSSSFLVSNNQRCAVNLQPFVEDLKAVLVKQPVLHADETGFYFNGQRNWLHTVCTDKYSFYAAHLKRGREAMNDINILPAYTGILMHDFWKSYYEFGCDHGLCNSHHLRDLTFCHQEEKSLWAADARQLLVDLYEQVATARHTDASATSLSEGQLQYWYTKYDDLMTQGLQLHPLAEKQQGKRGVVKKSKTQNMLMRFIEHKEEILAFAKNFLIPFTNNIAEQAIRMMKVKQKISGCFRSEQGAKDFADIRSYLATAKKQGISIIKALSAAMQGMPLNLTG